MSNSEDEELDNIRQLIQAEESGDHNTLGKAQADYLRVVSHIGSDDGRENGAVKSVRQGKSSYYGGNKPTEKRYENGWNQSVAKLLKQKRHKKPVVVSPKITVFALSKVLCQERRNAALVRDEISGKISGIITDAGMS